MNEREQLRKALEDISAMTYDSWTNGARAKEIADAAISAPQADAEDDDLNPIKEGWQVSFCPAGHSGSGVYAHMTEYPEEGAFLVFPMPPGYDHAEPVTPQADKVPAAEGASEHGYDADPKETVGELASKVGAWETPEGYVSFGSWQAVAAFHHHVLAGAARQWKQMHATPPAKLPQEAQPVPTDYDTAQRLAIKYGRSVQHEEVAFTRSALAAVIAEVRAPQPARADDEYQRGFADGAGIYRANAVKAIKEHQPARAVAVELDDALADYLEAQDALDNHELNGMNGKDYFELLRDRNAARKDLDAAIAAATTAATGKKDQDAARYRALRRGQHWSVINGIGDVLRADELDDAIDAATGGKCPDGLTPDGPNCPRCGGKRGESGVDGGSWVHIGGTK